MGSDFVVNLNLVQRSHDLHYAGAFETTRLQVCVQIDGGCKDPVWYETRSVSGAGGGKSLSYEALTFITNLHQLDLQLVIFDKGSLRVSIEEVLEMVCVEHVWIARLWMRLSDHFANGTSFTESEFGYQVKRI